MPTPVPWTTRRLSSAAMNSDSFPGLQGCPPIFPRAALARVSCRRGRGQPARPRGDSFVPTDTEWLQRGSHLPPRAVVTASGAQVTLSGVQGLVPKSGSFALGDRGLRRICRGMANCKPQMWLGRCTCNGPPQKADKSSRMGGSSQRLARDTPAPCSPCSTSG